jgi:phospholipid/cholesterol/gamma-HCH transport system substrate-binding protein
MLAATLLFFGSVATLAGLKFWNPKDRYFVHFTESVSGLEVGSTVKMSGVRVGQVEKYHIDKGKTSTVVVTLALEPGTPVKVDTRAQMTAIGITGLKFIELTGGTPTAPLLKPNRKTSTIKSDISVLHTLTGKASDIAQKMEGVLNNLLVLTNEGNRTRIEELLGSVNRLAGAWADLAGGDNPKRVRRILGNVDRTTAMLQRAAHTMNIMATENRQRVSGALQAAEGAARSIARSVQGLRPQATLTEINKTAKAVRDRVEDPAISKTVASLNRAASRMASISEEMSTVVRRRDRQLATILAQIDTAARDLKAFARAIRDRPSLLLRGQTRRERDVP